MKPRARRNGLLARDLGSERLVYDLERHEAHCLNASALRVYERCDGETTTREIVAQLQGELGAEVTEAWVRMALDGLAQAHLLEESDAVLPESHLLSPERRTILRRAGLGAALLLPAVISMVAPTPAEAAATCVPFVQCGSVPDGTPCYVGSQSECSSKQCSLGSCI